MTLTTPEPPAGVFEVLRRDLRRLARLSTSVVPARQVTVARGLPLYRAAADPGLEIVEAPHGWRFLVIDRDTAFWADVVGTSLDTVLTGPPVEQLLSVAMQADQIGADGEVRVLSFPLIDAEALWLSGRTEEFRRFSPVAEQVCDRQELFRSWTARLDDRVRAGVGALD